ncbi:hypothetical protein WA158_004008 [Blastocystis sp. Blastoise]
MSTTETSLSEDKYLFTFQDEMQLWISREFIEKYPQSTFYDIIKHSDRYDDGSYYIDIPYSPMNKVIDLLMDDSIDIFSLNLRDSYDIYKILYGYSVTIDNEIKIGLLFHIKDLFQNYLKENNYIVHECYCEDNSLYIPMELFSSKSRRMYSYASNIPLEYICPSCIKDIFPSLEELTITVTTDYKKTHKLLNPNSEEYIMEYICLFANDIDTIDNPKKYKYYSDLAITIYNKISNVDLNNIYYSPDLISSYIWEKAMNQLPKLYKYVVNEAIYTNDYSQVQIAKTIDENTIKDQIIILYDKNKNIRKLCIYEVSSKWGISQLLNLSSYFSISQIEMSNYDFSEYNAIIFIKLLEEGIFDSLTTLSVGWGSFKLSSIKKEHFPKLHILNYNVEISIENFVSLFPTNVVSMIDTIKVEDINFNQKERIIFLLDNLVFNHSIHIDGIVNSSCIVNIKKLDDFKNYTQNIDRLDISFKNYILRKDLNVLNEFDTRKSLERFLKSNILEHLNYLNISVDENISIERLKWISSLFNNNNFKTIHCLYFDLNSISKDSSSEYLIAYENIIKKLIPEASIVTIAQIKDIIDENFFEIYTKDNFHELESIEFRNDWDIELWLFFIQKLCKYIHNNSFPSSTIIRFSNTLVSNVCFTYHPNTSILRCKYDSHSFLDTIVGNKDKMISRYEIETLFDCYDISTEQITIYKQQLKDSSFIQENHVNYEFEKTL